MSARPPWKDELRRFRSVLLLIALSAVGCTARSWTDYLSGATVSERELTLAARAYLEASREVESVTVPEALHLTVALRGRGDTQVYLDNLFRGLATDPEARPAQLAKFLDTLLSDDSRSELSPVDVARVFPVVRDGQFVEGVAKAYEGSDTVIVEQLAGELRVLYVVDSPDSVRYITAKAAGDLRVAPSELREVAMKNFRQQLPAYRWEEQDGVRLLVADGTYESSFLLLPDFWTDLAHELGAEPTIAAPARGYLGVASSSNQGNVEALASWARELARASAYPMSPSLFEWNGSEWVLRRGDLARR